MPINPVLDAWLEAFIVAHGGIAGSVHMLTRGPTDPMLQLCASVRIPPPVVEATRFIPKGKGMAGLAWERGRPVQTCNLQSDASGDVRPGAKAVDARAAVAFPVYDEHGAIRGVVGIAFAGEREFTEDELSLVQHHVNTLPH
jgi:hypothetical protein